jgi:hypothetical protein
VGHLSVHTSVRPSGALLRAFLQSHIWPTTGQIWGTGVYLDSHILKFHVRCGAELEALGKVRKSLS